MVHNYGRADRFGKERSNGPAILRMFYSHFRRKLDDGQEGSIVEQVPNKFRRKLGKRWLQIDVVEGPKKLIAVHFPSSI